MSYVDIVLRQRTSRSGPTTSYVHDICLDLRCRRSHDYYTMSYVRSWLARIQMLGESDLTRESESQAPSLPG
jgi:hypothetical protein